MYRIYDIFRFSRGLLAGILLLLPGIAGLGQAAETGAAPVDDPQLTAFFQAMEEAYRNKRVPDVMAKLHKNFVYIMTYCTDDAFSVVENNRESYRTSVGSFFQRGPEVLEFAITIEHVERRDEKIAVVARIKSAVLLDGILNTCETSSNYNLLQQQGRLLIKDIRGNASCTNSKTAEAAEQ